MKKILCALLALIMMFATVAMAAQLPPLNATVVNSQSDTGIDIVVLIDRSGSMKTNDPKNIALAATKALASVSAVDNAGQQGGVNMAVITYGYGVVKTTEDIPGAPEGFVNVSDPTQLQRLEEFINGHETVDGWQDTDTGAAMEKAYSLIENRRENHSMHTFAVVMLSDGKVDIGDSDEFFAANPNLNKDERKKDKNNRSAEWTAAHDSATSASIQKGDDAAARLVNDGIALYGVGIYKNSADDLGTDMERWALSTGGDFKITKDINEVYDLMNDLYAQINQHAQISSFRLRSGVPGEFDVEVGVVQVNIVVRPSFSDISQCTIEYQDAQGTKIPFPTNKISFQNSTGSGDTYSVVSLNSPDPGKYFITINDGKDHEFDLDVFSIRDLDMKIESIDNIANGDTANIRLTVNKDGNPYHDDDPTRNQPKITISSAAGIVAGPDIQMTWDDNSKNYYFDFPTSQIGTYTVSVKLDKDGVMNQAAAKTFEVTPAPVRPRTNLANIDFTGHAVTKYDAAGAASAGYQPVVISYAELIANNFSNVDNRSISGYSYELDIPDGLVSVNNDPAAQTITITPVDGGNGTATISIRAMFEGAQSEPITGTINVQDAQAGVALSQDGMNINGKALQEVKGLLPTKAQVAETVGDDAVPAYTLNNVKNLFTEPNANDGEDFSVTAAVLEGGNASDGMTAAIDANGQLILTGAREGSYTVQLTATGYDGNTAVAEFGASVVNMLKFYVIIAAAALAAILLVIVIIIAVVNGGKPSFLKSATLIVRVECDGDESEEGVVKLGRYGKKAVKMTTICTSAHVSMFALRGTLDKVMVAPRKKGGIEISYNIKGLGKKTITMSSMDDRTIELDSNGDRLIELSYDAGDSH